LEKCVIAGMAEGTHGKS